MWYTNCMKRDSKWLSKTGGNNMQQERRGQNQEVEDEFVSYDEETIQVLTKMLKGKEEQVDRMISTELYVQTIVTRLEDIFGTELGNQIEQNLRQELTEDMYEIKLVILNRVMYGQLVRNPNQTFASILESLLEEDPSLQEDIDRVICEHAQESVAIGVNEANLLDVEQNRCPYYEA